MAEYVCRVADGNGRVFALVEPAQSHEEARQKLQDRGLLVYEVRPRGGILPSIGGQPRASSVGGSEFLILNQQFNTLIKAGLPILRALDLLAERAAAPKLRPIVSQLRDRVREGRSLSEAVEETGAFSKVYSTAVLAGEKSGNLSGVLEQNIAYQRVTTSVKKKILATLVYPTILITGATAIVSYFVAYVIPQFAKVYEDLDLPLPVPTKLLIAITVQYRYVVLSLVGILVLSAIGLYLWSRTEEGGAAFDRLKFKLPVIGNTLLKFQLAQFSRTLSPLLSGGTPLVAGLQTAGEAIGSKLLRGAVAEATKMVREGQSLHGALSARGVMPVLALDMIEVGESSGALSPMLNSVAEFYEEEASLRLGAMVSVIEPVILVFMALLVLFILIALYLPIFSFSSGGVQH